MAGQHEKTAFVLSGGGARGAAQVGMLRALVERGIVPDLVVGTSAGAVNGAWFGLHPDRLDELERVWLQLRTRVVFPGTPAHAVYHVVRHGHVHAVHGWRRILTTNFGDARLENAAIPTGVVTVRLRDGAVVVFDSGRAAPALVASTAVPGLFPPQAIEGTLYVDGGIVECLPIPSATARGATTVYALDCSDYWIGEVDPRSTVDRCGQIGATASARTAVAMARGAGHRVYWLRPSLGDLHDGRDFGRTARLIAAGYDHALTALADDERARTA